MIIELRMERTRFESSSTAWNLFDLFEFYQVQPYESADSHVLIHKNDNSIQWFIYLTALRLGDVGDSAH